MMMPTLIEEQARVAPLAYHRAQARLGSALPMNALILCRLVSNCKNSSRSDHITQTELMPISCTPERLMKSTDLPLLVRIAMQDSYQLLIWGTPLEKEVFNFFTVKRNGEEIKYNGRLVKRADPSLEAYMIMNPGQALSQEVDLSTSYAFDKPGKYTVTVNGRIHDAFKISSAGKQKPRKMDQFEGFEISRAKANFTCKS